jgi:hypothetical protein
MSLRFRGLFDAAEQDLGQIPHADCQLHQRLVACLSQLRGDDLPHQVGIVVPGGHDFDGARQDLLVARIGGNESEPREVQRGQRGQSSGPRPGR